jgi:hypothetical protein
MNKGLMERVNYLFTDSGANRRMSAASDLIRYSIEDFRGAVVQARKLVENGVHVDLSGMEARMAALCDGAVALPPQVGRAVCPELINMGSQIDELIDALKKRRP